MKLLRRLAPLALCAALVGLSTADNTAGAAEFPGQPIKIIVGFSAGSATDMVARIVSRQMTENLGVPVIVENKTGAAGSIGALAVVRSKPDGYTLLLSTTALATNAAVKKVQTFDAAKDLTPIGLVGWLPEVLTIRAGLPATDLKSFITLAKSRKLSYGSSGVGGSTHLSAELFDRDVGISMIHVPFRGNDQALAALIGGQVDVLFDNVLSAIGQVHNTKIRQIAISSEKRNPKLPEVPTFAQQGHGKSGVRMLFGLFGPADLPPRITARLNSALNDAITESATHKLLSQQSGMEVTPTDPAGFKKIYMDELKQWRDLAHERGISLD
jgi:tripartite-type tricarboxylate transporter receptor subunit TctC